MLGDLAAPDGLLRRLVSRDNSPRRANGSAYGGGWYGYVQKDLRSLLGRRVRGAYSRRYCGGGELLIKRSADALAPTQGPDPSAWRSDATEERFEFQPGVLGPEFTMRWTNRPTMHQLMAFRGYRRLG